MFLRAYPYPARFNYLGLVESDACWHSQTPEANLVHMLEGALKLHISGVMLYVLNQSHRTMPHSEKSNPGLYTIPVGTSPTPKSSAMDSKSSLGCGANYFAALVISYSSLCG